MPLRADRHAAVFVLSGPEFEPVGDPAWTRATKAERTAYHNEVARLAFEAKRAELNKGIDVHGQKLPARRQPRPDGATGPVLDPHWSESRFQTYLRYQGEVHRAIVWWAKPWSIVVQGHATGRATGVIRDVVGLTSKKQEWVARNARKWWANRVQRGRDLGPFGRSDTMTPVPKKGVRQVIVVARSKPEAAAVATPTFAAELAPWTVQQRLDAIYQAASEARTTEAQIAATVRALARVPVVTLQAVALRYGISPTPLSKSAALDLIERQLLGRLKEARRLGRGPGGTGPPKPKPGPTRPAPPSQGPGPNPKPTPPVRAVALTHYGQPSPGFVQQIEGAVAGLSDRTKRRIARAGIEVAVAQKLGDARPDLVNVQPRGWPAGSTWANADGLSDGNRVLACETYLSPLDGTVQRSSRGPGVIRHEIGHGIDKSGPRRLSHARRFRAAYAADVADLATTAGLEYYLQVGDAGLQELFAELFAQLSGGGAARIDLPAHFPRCAAILRRLIG